jgi:peptidoglycan/LPS O-acetylase OafA/YrhL
MTQHTTPSSAPAHPAYRKDIDGLRAVAVLAVLGFHAFPERVPGGFVGVDVFFVISGYLISTIILGNLRAGRFSFADFYARRVRRIFPALGLVLAACLAIGWFVLLADEYEQLGKHVVAGAGFVANLLLWHESGYFDVDSALKPLLHLWSLGVEEQFYLVWPLALWIGWRARWNIGLLTWGILLGSFAWDVVLVRTDPTAAFYSPGARFWELMLGALLAHWTVARDARDGAIAPRRWLPTTWHATLQDIPWVRNLLSLLGIGMIAAALVFLTPDQPFPGWRALPPALGALLLLMAGPKAACNRWLLSNRAMVFVGAISYPLYLWHWPLLAFARIREGEVPDTAVRAGLLALSFVLACATWRLVENPIRFGGHRRAKVAVAVTAMAVVAIAGAATLQQQGVLGRFDPDVRPYANFQYEFKTDARSPGCWLSLQAAPDAYAAECVDPPDGDRPLLVLWGDSHAARLYPGLRDALGSHYRLAQFTRSACPPLHDRRGRGNCRPGNDYVMRRIAALQPTTVVLFARWASYGRRAKDRKLLEGTVRELRQEGVDHVVVIGPAPEWKQPLPKTLVTQHQATGKPVPGRTRQGLRPGLAALDARLRTAVVANGGEYLSSRAVLCNARGCLTRIGHDPANLTTWDYGHLTTVAARYLAKHLAHDSGDFGLAQ